MVDSVVVTRRDADAQDVDALVRAGMPPTLARLFAARGVRSADQTVLHWKGLIPPAEMLNCAKAAALIADAIQQHKRILIVADYDCDGATACTVAVRGLRMFGAHVDYVVPNRFETGYGLSPAVIDLVRQRFDVLPDLIITVDNGIASVEGVEYAKQYGMEVIVTDHHLPGEQLPDALTIVNPNQPGCSFPSKSIAGCGVFFYVLMALRSHFRELGLFNGTEEPRLAELSDLVAVGTVADVVRLDENNRILVHQGLRRIRHGLMCNGLKALFEVASSDYQTATTMDLGFKIGPRINAAGRLADMSIGIACLLSNDYAEAFELANELNVINSQRRKIEAGMSATALNALQEDSLSDTQSGLCVFHEDWHQGVVGILASRLKEKFWKPVIAFAKAEDGLITGSGRSVPEVHIRDTLDLVSKRHSDLIIKFGGHAMAAGLTIRESDLDRFREAFLQAIFDLSGKAQFSPVLETDGALSAQEITLNTAELIKDQVWGTGFPYPSFMDTFRIRSQRILKDRHSKLLLEKDGLVFDAIWFNHSEMLPDYQDFVYEIDANYWNGQSNVQLVIKFARDSQ